MKNKYDRCSVPKCGGIILADTENWLKPLCNFHYEQAVIRWPTGIFGDTIGEMFHECVEAKTKFPPFNSAHEAFAVLNEEFDELKQHVWTNQKKRDLEAMRQEAIQVGAMALRFACEVCDEKVGRK